MPHQRLTLARLERFTASRRAQTFEGDGAVSLDLSDVQAVSVGWLAKVFSMEDARAARAARQKAEQPSKPARNWFIPGTIAASLLVLFGAFGRFGRR